MSLLLVLFVCPSPLLGEGRSRVGGIFLLLLFVLFFLPRGQTPERAALPGGQRDTSFWPSVGLWQEAECLVTFQ